jgi:hypothetical protein
MGIAKPYYRIFRPYEAGSARLYHPIAAWPDYFLVDTRYANDRQELWRAYKLIEKDLLRLFEYVEPTDDNIHTYSHRTYELLLRAATEFETNCKRILESNGYANRKLYIKDYSKINKSSRLGEYAVSLRVWHPQGKKLEPFAPWNGGGHSLPWYQSYNDVKHHRNQNFPKASLENVLCAIAGLYIILFSQFLFASGLPWSSHYYEVSQDQTAISMPGDIFEMLPPLTWTEEELYRFDWENIKDSPEPFDKFEFK